MPDPETAHQFVSKLFIEIPNAREAAAKKHEKRKRDDLVITSENGDKKEEGKRTKVRYFF